MGCHAAVEKFADYIFKPGATHGKDHVFRSLGYGRTDAETLAGIYEQQAALKYAAGEYTLGRQDEYGRRINVVIELQGVGDAEGKFSHIVSGWMVQADGDIHLSTPFSGFARARQP